MIESGAALLSIEVLEVLRSFFEDLGLAGREKRRQLIAYVLTEILGNHPIGSKPATRRNAVRRACQSLRCVRRTLRPAGVSR